MDTSVVDDLGRDLVKIAKIGIVILILLALLLIGANCALEWYKWRCLKSHMQYTREAWTSDPSVAYTGSKSAPTIHLSDHNLMLITGDMQHPLLTKIANRIARILRFSPSQYINLTWFFHYVFHPPALACFLIGFFGLLSVEIQLIAIGPLEHKYSQQAVRSVNDFSNTIATSINASMYNQSAAYANDINTRVDKIQSTVNDGLFGWVNGTTTTLNSTINTFYTDIQDAVNTVFNGTILEEPIQEFIRCFIGSKVDAIETALTFLHDNLNIDIPRVNDSVLVLSSGDVNEAVQPIATAAIGGGNGNDQGVIGKLVNAYVESIKKERIVFSIFMGLWLIVVLMALAIIFWHSRGRDWLEAYKKRKWQRKQRVGVEGLVVPFRDIDHSTFGGDIEKSQQLDPQCGRGGSPISKTITLAPHPYPHGRDPAFEKSWETFLDGANAHPESEPKPKLTRWATLGSLGSLRRTQTVAETGDGEDSQSSSSDQPLWMKPFTPSFWKRKNSQSDDEASIKKSPSPTRERVRPQLTITTSDGAVRDLDNASNDGVVPTSAWSLSPRRPTWISSITPPKLPTIRSKPRHRASVPSDVRPVDAPPFEAPESVTPFAVPLHHGFDRPVPPPPSLQFPAYTASTPPVYINHHLSPPPTATTGSRARQDAVDPFATPFDDERYAVTNNSPTFDRKRATNPFEAL